VSGCFVRLHRVIADCRIGVPRQHSAVQHSVEGDGGWSCLGRPTSRLARPPAADGASKSGAELARHDVVQDRIRRRTEVVQNTCERTHKNAISTWPIVTSRIDTTRHVRRVEPVYFGAVLSLSNSTARHAQHDERDWLDTLDTTS